jgi:DNA-binding XRE family transcriptional regulator
MGQGVGAGAGDGKKIKFAFQTSTPQTYGMDFAQWLKKQRLARDLTQAQAAKFLQMGRSKYIKLEAGTQQPTHAEEHGLRPLFETKADK